MDGEYHYSQFRDIFGKRDSNNPHAFAKLATILENFVQVIKDDFEPGLNNTIRAAEKATALLFCAIVTAKQENIDLGFYQLIDKAKGRTTGAKLLSWTLSKMDFNLAEDLKVAWGGISQQMANSLDMMILELEPTGHVTNVDQATAWIKECGGVGKLSMAFLNWTNKNKEQEAKDQRLGKYVRKEQEAREAGFESIIEYEAHLVEKKKEKSEIAIRAKFPTVKKKLIENGTTVVSPEDQQLLIYSDGKLYAISERDEYVLLSGYAVTL